MSHNPTDASAEFRATRQLTVMPDPAEQDDDEAGAGVVNATVYQEGDTINPEHVERVLEHAADAVEPVSGAAYGETTAADPEANVGPSLQGSEEASQFQEAASGRESPADHREQAIEEDNVDAAQPQVAPGNPAEVPEAYQDAAERAGEGDEDPDFDADEVDEEGRTDAQDSADSASETAGGERDASREESTDGGETGNEYAGVSEADADDLAPDEEPPEEPGEDAPETSSDVPNPANMTNKEVREWAKDTDDAAAIREVLEAEENNRSRKGATQALSRRLDRLEGR